MTASSEDIERENRELARRSERLGGAMRELEHFSFGIAHDLWAPLRSINDIARGIDEGAGGVDAETQAKVRSILAHGATMEGMIENLLEFCRYASMPLELETIDMEALVREAWAGIGGKERAALVLDKLPVARGHRAMLKLVWSNLLANALRYGVRTQWPHVEVTGGESPGHVIYGVRDNGAGFDLGYSGKLAHVFLRLATAAEYPGTGVALAIVQRIVTRHRGNVWIDARAGEGAFFQFSLPLHDAEP
jgi:light-regulated signal transduction histidine kinase (bacteriophytochrome)